MLEPANEIEEVQLQGGAPDKKVKIGAGLVSWLKEGLMNLLKEFVDIFAWSPADMPGIPRDIIEHELAVDEEHKPVRQKKRSFGPEKSQLIDAEIDKLLQVNIIREVHYPTWLANPVLVKKGKRRMENVCRFHEFKFSLSQGFFPAAPD